MKRGWEKEWWDGIIEECESAEDQGDVGGLYRGLKKLGLRERDEEGKSRDKHFDGAV